MELPTGPNDLIPWARGDPANDGTVTTIELVKLGPGNARPLDTKSSSIDDSIGFYRSPEALAMLAEALELHAGGGEPIEDEEAFLEEIGIDPREIATARTEHDELPEFLR